MASGLPPDLPPGFRFRPSDRTIVRDYLMHKIRGTSQGFDPAVIIANAYNKSPQQLILLDINNHGIFRENEWYFYTSRPIGGRYATTNGHYFAPYTQDEQIFQNNQVVGFKRLLRFYLEPGLQTDWVVHEYRVNPALFGHIGVPQLYWQAASSFVMCKMIRTSDVSDSSLEEVSDTSTESDAANSPRTNMDELQGKHLHLQSCL